MLRLAGAGGYQRNTENGVGGKATYVCGEAAELPGGAELPLHHLVEVEGHFDLRQGVLVIARLDREQAPIGQEVPEAGSEGVRHDVEGSHIPGRRGRGGGEARRPGDRDRDQLCLLREVELPAVMAPLRNLTPSARDHDR